MNTAHHKDLLRYHLRRQRALAQADYQELTAAFTEQILAVLPSSARTLAAFLPVPGEPPIKPALERAYRAGLEVLVPVVQPGRQLAWVSWSPDMQHPRSAFGIEEPDGERRGAEAFVQADFHLIPALAYDRFGRRLGQGGGFYDSLLSQADSTSPAYCGVVFDRELLDGLPAEAHDARLGQILSENGIYRCR